MTPLGAACAGIGFVQTLLVLTLGTYMVDVPNRGSLLLLFGSSALFLVSMLGLGLLVSVATKSQSVPVELALMASMMPGMMLSGFIYPIDNGRTEIPIEDDESSTSRKGSPSDRSEEA